MTSELTSPALGNGERMAGASASAIAADPSLSVAQIRMPTAAVDYDAGTEGVDDQADAAHQPAPAAERAPGEVPIGGTSTLEAVKAGGFERDDVMAVLNWVRQDSALQPHEREAIDASSVPAARGELAQLWGGNYAANVAKINDYIDNHFNATTAFAIRNARDTDGQAFANKPAFLQRLLGLARQAPSKGNSAGDVDAQIADIERLMRRDRASYDRDGQTQKRYLELLVQKHGR